MTDATALDAAATEPAADWTSAMVPDLRRLAPNILVAGVLPIVAYALLRPHVSSDAVALAAVMVFPVGEITFERIRFGRFEPVGIISLIGIAAGLIGAVAMNGDALLLKLRESMLTGLFGLVCLASLPAPRPAMFYMGRAFATGGDPVKSAGFEQMWALPGVRRRFRIVTSVWGVGLGGEAGLRTLLAVTLSTQAFLIVSQVVAGCVLGGLLWFTIRFSRASERRLTAIHGELAVPPPGSVLQASGD
ncbi:MAG TPA: VC0807 family protein [Acidimicrobiales bacterium]